MGATSSRWFAGSAGAILFVVGLAKIWSGLGQAKVLTLADPILGVSFGKLMLLVGAAELVVASICFSKGIGPRLKVGLIAWLATNFVVYRVGLWSVGWQHPCHCMGSLAGALHLSDKLADGVMKWVLVYLVVGSYLALWFQYRADRPARAKGTGALPAA